MRFMRFLPHYKKGKLVSYDEVLCAKDEHEISAINAEVSKNKHLIDEENEEVRLAEEAKQKVVNDLLDDVKKLTARVTSLENQLDQLLKEELSDD